MQVGDLVEGFATNVEGLKGILTKIEYRLEKTPVF